MTTGKSRADFPGAFIPFDRGGRPVPSVAIDSAPTVQLCINQDWLPFVIGALKALSRPETWDDTYNNSVIAASEFATLIGDIQDGCGVLVPTIMCASGSFTDLDYGFVPTPGGGCVATWASGVGWQMCADSTPQGFLQVKREFGFDTLIREVHLKFTTNVPYLLNVDVTLYHDGTFTNIISDHATTGPTLDYNVTGLTEVASAIFINVVETLGGAAADTVLTDFGLCYTGAFPLAQNPNTGRFTHIFDFLTSDGGFSNWVGTSWVSGQGWVGSRVDSHNFADHIRRLGFPLRTVDHIEMTSYLDLCGGANCAHRIEGLLGSTSIFDGDFASAPGTSVWSWDGLAGIDGLQIANNGGDTSTSAKITRLIVSGFGSDPF